MANLNAILKNKMGLSAEQAKKSKVLASLSGSYRQNMKSIHYTQLVQTLISFTVKKNWKIWQMLSRFWAGLLRIFWSERRMQNSMKFWPDTADGGPVKS